MRENAPLVTVHKGRSRQPTDRYMPAGKARHPWEDAEFELGVDGLRLTKGRVTIWRPSGWSSVEITPAKDRYVFRIQNGSLVVEFMPEDYAAFKADVERLRVSQPSRPQAGATPNPTQSAGSRRPTNPEVQSGDRERSGKFAYGAVAALVMMAVGLGLVSSGVENTLFNVVMFSVSAAAWGGWMIPGVRKAFTPSFSPRAEISGVGFTVFALTLIIAAGGLTVGLDLEAHVVGNAVLAAWVVVLLGFAIWPVRRVFDQIGIGLIFMAVYVGAVAIVLGQTTLLGVLIWGWITGRLRVGLVWVVLLFGGGSYLVFRQLRWAARTGWETVEDLARGLTKKRTRRRQA